jgi:hypothetical protein
MAQYAARAHPAPAQRMRLQGPGQRVCVRLLAEFPGKVTLAQGQKPKGRQARKGDKMTHVPKHPSDEQLKAMLWRLTFWELDELVSGFSFVKLPGDEETPPFYRDKTKAENIAIVVRWARRASAAGIAAFMERLEAALRQKDSEELIRRMKRPLPGTRFIRWAELEKMPSFPLIKRAITFRFDPSRAASPVTRDGYVSVAAIYNMSYWADWKARSLDPSEAALARAINELPLGELMALNRGRRTDQPAFFPVGFMLPREGRRG